MFVTLKSFITFFIHATVSTSTINGMSDYAVAQQIRCGVHITYCVTLQGLKKKLLHLFLCLLLIVKVIPTYKST